VAFRYTFPKTQNALDYVQRNTVCKGASFSSVTDNRSTVAALPLACQIFQSTKKPR